MKRRIAVFERAGIDHDYGAGTPVRNPVTPCSPLGAVKPGTARVTPPERHASQHADGAAVSRIADECQVLAASADLAGADVATERFIEVISKTPMPEGVRGKGAVALVAIKLLARFAEIAAVRIAAEAGDAPRRQPEVLSLTAALRAAAAALGQIPPARPQLRVEATETSIPNTAKHALLALRQMAYRPGIRLHEVAAIVDVSPSHLDRLLKRHVGQSFVRVINGIRVSRACWLLDTTTLSVKEVSYKAGFNSPTNFSRTFRRSHGCTPKQWRNRMYATRNGS